MTHPSPIVLLALLAVAGCTQAGPGDAACIQIVDTQIGDVRDTFAAAEFRSGTGCPSIPRPPSGCRLVRTPESPFFRDGTFVPPPGALAPAGDVVVSGLAEDVALESVETGLYDATLPPLPVGAMLSVSGTGDEIVPFSIDALAPGIPVVTAPASVGPGEDLALTWEPPPGEPVMEIVVTDTLAPFGGRSASLHCTLDPALGRMFVPATDLAQLDTHGTRSDLFVTATYRVTELGWGGGLNVRLDVRTEFVGPAVAR
jgi:hypothetical protein